jgi:hypothetical protein
LPISDKSVLGLQNNLLDGPFQPIGKGFSNNLVNFTHKIDRAKVLEINGPSFFGMREMKVALRLFSNLLLA